MSHFENKCFASTSIAYNMFALLIFPGSKVHFQEFDTKSIPRHCAIKGTQIINTVIKNFVSNADFDKVMILLHLVFHCCTTFLFSA